MERGSEEVQEFGGGVKVVIECERVAAVDKKRL